MDTKIAAQPFPSEVNTIARLSHPDPSLVALLPPEQVRIPLATTGKAGILRELSGHLAAGAGIPDQAEEILRAIERREALLSTGIGNGVAIPHAKVPILGSMVMAVGTTVEPVEFDALDGRPVRLVWMLAGPERTAGLHVRTLGRISEILRSDPVRTGLIEAGSADQFLTRLLAAERE